MTVAEHIKALSEAMQSDSDYAWTWQCNLACIAIDSSPYVTHERANRTAAQFMKNAFGVDIKQNEHWHTFERQWMEEKKRELDRRSLQASAIQRLDESSPMAQVFGPNAIVPECSCHACLEKNNLPHRFMLMIVCPKCGNKRCPKAINCVHKCTGSNMPGQIGELE